MYQNKPGDQLKTKPLISVIICTYNRANYLEKCLDSMIDQSYANFEVIVVNGPSTDNTKEILKGYPFRVIQQKEKEGLSAARNIGIREAKGEIIAFIDDDAVADINWLKELLKLYTEEKIASVGGKIVPIWISEKPGWYSDQLSSYLSLLDFSRSVEQMNFPYTPYGCNMSFRKAIFTEIGYFDVSLGRYPSNLLSHDEIDLYKRIYDKGYKVMYNPKSLVYHSIDSSRISKIWFKKRSYWNGISIALYHKKYYGTSYVLKLAVKALLLGIPYNLLLYLFEKIKKKENEQFIRELNILSKFGYVKHSFCRTEDWKITGLFLLLTL